MIYVININSCNIIKLEEHQLIGLCELNGFKPRELNSLYLNNNKLIDLDFITENTPFINLKELCINNNKISDIDNIRYLKNLEILYMNYNKLNEEKETIEILKTMTNLKVLDCYYTFRKYTKEQLKKELPNIKII